MQETGGLAGGKELVMPTRHGNGWRIRWIDEHGRRKSAVYDDYKLAQTEERKRKVEVEEIRRGMRTGAPPDKTFNAIADYWLEKRAVHKRSRKDDESIIRKHLRPAFGSMLLKNIGVEEAWTPVALPTPDGVLQWWDSLEQLFQTDPGMPSAAHELLVMALADLQRGAPPVRFDASNASAR